MCRLFLLCHTVSPLACFVVVAYILEIILIRRDTESEHCPDYAPCIPIRLKDFPQLRTRTTGVATGRGEAKTRRRDIGTTNRFDDSRIRNVLLKHASGLDFLATPTQREQSRTR